MKDTITFPTGYPYMLYKVDDNFVVACTEQQAASMTTAKEKPAPLSVMELIGDVGYAETNRILKRYGNSWICKEGRVFYGKRPEVS